MTLPPEPTQPSTQPSTQPGTQPGIQLAESGQHTDLRQLTMDRASAQLKERTRRQGLQVANDVLSRVLSHPRRSLPVRAHPPLDHLHVSEQILTAAIRARIDTHVPRVAVQRIVCVATPHELLEQVTVILTSQYGNSLDDDATRVHQAIREVLTQLLGPRTDDIDVAISHVHIDDISPGDPFLSDTDQDIH